MAEDENRTKILILKRYKKYDLALGLFLELREIYLTEDSISPKSPKIIKMTTVDNAREYIPKALGSRILVIRIVKISPPMWLTPIVRKL